MLFDMMEKSRLYGTVQLRSKGDCYVVSRVGIGGEVRAEQ